MDALIQEQTKFFDNLVELIPAKHYYDDEFEHKNLKFMKQAERAALKQEMKENYKKSKKAKLDPNQALTTLAVQKQKLKANQQPGPAADGRPGSQTTVPAGAPAIGTLNLSGASRQELQDRLRQKIEQMRSQKQDKEKTAQAAKQWRQNTLLKKDADGKLLNSGSKRKLEAGKDTESLRPAKQPNKQLVDKGQQQHAPSKQQQQQKQTEDTDFTFGRVELDTGKKAQFGKKKPSKEQLLAQAEAKKQDLNDLQQTQDGKAKLSAEAWKAALARAQGEKVLDDPRLLKKSIKREAKLKEKKAKQWQDRLQHQKDQMDARQEKRQGNIQARAQAKKDKKKEKREKKLLRAGFEGRKDGFIGVKKPAAQ